jgi:hypothetical protein
MSHPLYRETASELSYLVLQKRRQEAQLSSPPLDSTNQRLYSMGGRSIFDGYVAERAIAADSYQGEARRFWPVEGK